MRRFGGIDIATYGRAFGILVRFPQVMLLPLCVAVLEVLLYTIMPAGNGILAAANGGLSGLFTQLLTSFGLCVAIIVADSAWRFGSAPFDSAWEQARRKGGDIIIAALGVSFVTFIASIVGGIIGEFGSIALFLVANFFMIYALPAAAIGGIPGGASLQISIERARSAVAPTLLLSTVYLAAVLFAPTLILTALSPLLVPLLSTKFASSSGAIGQLVVAAVKAPVYAYIGIVMAKVYEDISYGRRLR